MVIPINIDVKPLIEKFSIDKEHTRPLVTGILNNLLLTIRDEWIQASNVLGGTRAQYQRGIYVEKIDYKSAIIGLTGWLPNAIEQGIGAFDMKVGFSRSSKRVTVMRKDKDGNESEGWYLTIPFRHGSSGIIGESQAFSGVMPDDVHKVAKGLDSNEHIKRAMLPPGYAENLGSRPRIVTEEKVWETYHHKHSIYEGIQRSDKPHHASYVSFRRVSDNSDENSWIHKGLQARNFFDKAVKNSNIPRLIERERDKFLDSLGF